MLWNINCERGIRVEMKILRPICRKLPRRRTIQTGICEFIQQLRSGLGNQAQKEFLVEAYQEGERFVVRFTDSGPGSNDLARAFDPFYSTRPVGQGTGWPEHLLRHSAGTQWQYLREKPAAQRRAVTIGASLSDKRHKSLDEL